MAASHHKEDLNVMESANSANACRRTTEQIIDQFLFLNWQSDYELKMITQHSFQQGCKYSQLHMSVRHDHEHERTEHNMSRLQPTHRRVGALPQSHPGLCGTPVGPGKDTHGTPVPGREGRGWPDTSSTRRPRQTTTLTQVLSQTCFQETSGQTLVFLHGSGAARRSRGRRVEVETSRIIKIAQRNETHHPGEDQPRDQDSAESVH